MPSNSKEYMREYRARRKSGLDTHIIEEYGSVALAAASSRIAELEEEVRRLKVELAGRPAIRVRGDLPEASQGPRVGIRRDVPFGSPRPAPKTTRKK